MPLASASPSVVETARPRSASLSIAVAVSVLSLGSVIAGFTLVALTLLGTLAVPLGWGAGLCVGGWALAAIARERARTRSASTSAE